MIRICVLASGSGTNLEALAEGCRRGYIPGEILLVISERPGAGALEKASAAGIEGLVLEWERFSGPEEFSGAVLREVRKRDIDLICLAGFLKKLSGRLLSEYEMRIMNIHPALLPSYGGKGMYGLRVHRAVLESGEKESGCTVHFIDGEYDRGQVIARRRVPVREGDTPESLAERVLRQEHKLYPEAVRKFALGEIGPERKI